MDGHTDLPAAAASRQCHGGGTQRLIARALRGGASVRRARGDRRTNVIVRDGMIAAIGPHASVPGGATIFLGAGHTLLRSLSTRTLTSHQQTRDHSLGFGQRMKNIVFISVTLGFVRKALEGVRFIPEISFGIPVLRTLRGVGTDASASGLLLQAGVAVNFGQ